MFPRKNIPDSAALHPGYELTDCARSALVAASLR
jgi:hypothetical protein